MCCVRLFGEFCLFGVGWVGVGVELCEVVVERGFGGLVVGGVGDYDGGVEADSAGVVCVVGECVDYVVVVGDGG